MPILPGIPGLRRSLGGYRRFGPQAFTQADAAIYPYIQEAAAEETRQRNLLQPVEALFDILDRPGAAVRGGVRELVQGGPDALREAGQAAVAGLTGQGKKVQTSDILTDLGWDPRGPVGKAAKWIAGFVGDVAMDPLTYVNPLAPLKLAAGASEAGMAAARQYAAQAVTRAARRGGSLGRLAGKIKEGFDPAEVTRLLNANKVGAARRLAVQHGGVDFAREMDRVYSTSLREALRMTPEQAKAKFLANLTAEQKEIMGSALERYPKTLQEREVAKLQKRLAKAVDEKAAGRIQRRLQRVQSPEWSQGRAESVRALLEGGEGPKSLARTLGRTQQRLADVASEIERVRSDPAMFEHLGERATRVLGKEVFKGTRAPNVAAQQWDNLRNWFGQQKTPFGKGSTLSDAWWGIMNTGPVGAFRKALGFRNPYQKLQRMRELEAGPRGFKDGVFNRAAQVSEIFRGTDDILPKYVQLVAEAEKLGPDVTMQQVLSNARVQERLGIVNPAMQQRLLDLHQSVDSLMRELRGRHAALNQAGYVVGMDAIEHYLPIQAQIAGQLKGVPRARGTPTPGYTLTRAQGLSASSEQQVVKLKAFWGMSDADARKAVFQGNLSSLQLDPREMVMSRLMAAEKVEARVRMIDAFREFGVSVNDLRSRAPLGTDPFPGFKQIEEMGTKAFQGMLKVEGQTLEQFGLRQIRDPALKGLFFDADVAEVFERATKVTATDNAMETLRTALAKYNSLWKSINTATGGFHMRNMFSNNVTGFLRYGFEWFNLDKYALPAWIGTTYALKDANPLTAKMWQGILATLGEENVGKILSRKFGGHTLDEWTRYSLRTGVLNRTFGREERATEAVQLLGKPAGARANPLNPDFLAYEMSRNLGTVVEGQPRLQSFLMGIERMSGGKQVSMASRQIMEPAGGTRLAESSSGDAIVEAAKQDVFKYFFDYEDLTDAERAIFRDLIPFGCFDNATDVLTPSGWKTHETLRQGDAIYSVNLDTHEIELDRVRTVKRYPFDGELVRLSGRNIDTALTPNHRCIFWTQTEHSWRIKQAHELAGNDWLPIATDGWRPDRKRIHSDEFVELVGWIVTEGVVDASHVRIIQHEKNYVQAIRECLERSDFQYSERKRGGGIVVFSILKPGADLFRKFFQNGAKDLPLAFLQELTRPQMELLLETMVLGDGAHDKGGSFFMQKSRKVAEAVQILGTLCGRATRLQEREPTAEGRYGKGPLCYVRLKGVANVQVRNNLKAPMRYKGIVWCPNTRNGTVIARRNGIVYPTGQTWLRKNLALQISQIIEYPQAYAIIPKGQAAATDLGEAASGTEADLDRQNLPAYLVEEGAIPLGEVDGQQTILRPDFAYMDLNVIPFVFEKDEGVLPQLRLSLQETFDDIFNRTHPFIKTAAELASGRDLFRKMDLGVDAPAPRALRLLTKNATETPNGGLLGFLDGLMRAAGDQDGLHLGVDPKGRLTMDARVAKILENNLPLLRQVGTWLDVPAIATSMAGLPIESVIREATGAVSDYPQRVETLLQGLSNWGGIKLRQIDEASEAMNRAYEIYNAAQEARRKVEAPLPGFQARSTQSRLANQRRFQRLGIL